MPFVTVNSIQPKPRNPLSAAAILKSSYILRQGTAQKTGSQSGAAAMFFPNWTRIYRPARDIEIDFFRALMLRPSPVGRG